MKTSFTNGDVECDGYNYNSLKHDTDWGERKCGLQFNSKKSKATGRGTQNTVSKVKFVTFFNYTLDAESSLYRFF